MIAFLDYIEDVGQIVMKGDGRNCCGQASIRKGTCGQLRVRRGIADRIRGVQPQ